MTSKAAAEQFASSTKLTSGIEARAIFRLVAPQKRQVFGTRRGYGSGTTDKTLPILVVERNGARTAVAIRHDSRMRARHRRGRIRADISTPHAGCRTRRKLVGPRPGGDQSAPSRTRRPAVGRHRPMEHY